MANEPKQQQQQQPPKPEPLSPPSVSVPPPNVNWVEEVDVWLKSKGWEKLGSNETGIGIWQDPGGSRRQAEPTTIVELPGVGGSREIVKQWTGPPTPWVYNTYEAMWVQQERDKAGGGISPIQRLEELEKLYNGLDAHHKQVKTTIERVLSLPVPTKAEELQKFLAVVKNLLADSLGARNKAAA